MTLKLRFDVRRSRRALELTHGGKELHYIPCLNDNPVWIEAMHAIASMHLEGWSLDAPDASALATSLSEAISRGGV